MSEPRKPRTRAANGYVRIYQPTHPHCSRSGHVWEHRLVMEAHIGRLLTPTEVVHHINENTSDNDIDNLMLFANDTQHSIYHANLRRVAQFMATCQSIPKPIVNCDRTELPRIGCPRCDGLGSVELALSHIAIFDFISKNPECYFSDVVIALGIRKSEARTAIEQLRYNGVVNRMHKGRHWIYWIADRSAWHHGGTKR